MFFVQALVARLCLFFGGLALLLGQFLEFQAQLYILWMSLIRSRLLGYGKCLNTHISTAGNARATLLEKHLYIIIVVCLSHSWQRGHAIDAAY